MERLKLIKRVHLIFAILVTVMGAWGIWKDKFTDPYYVVILIGLSWITMIFYWFMKTYRVQGILLLVTLASGIYGFWEHSYGVYGHTLFNAVYSTIRLFFLDVDVVFNKAGNKFVHLPLPIEIARWSAAFYTISTIGLLMLRYFGLSVKGEWYRFFGGHIIVTGINKQSALLIRNLRKDKYKVSVIADEFTPEQKKELFDLGVPIFTGVSFNSELFTKSGLSKANYVILINDDDSVILDAYLSIREFMKITQRENLPVLLHLDHAKSKQVYEGLSAEENKHIKSYSFSSYQLIAEKMLKDNPLYIGYEDQLRNPGGEPLHLLFIGFGKTNQQLAFQALNSAHYLTNKKVRITICDRDIEKVKKEWSYVAKAADELAEIQYMKIDLLNQGLRDEILQITEPITHVYVGLQNDFLDMVEGLELINILPNIPIFIKMRDDRQVSNWLHEHQDEFKHVQRYANFSDVLNSKYVLNEELIRLAKQAHENYQKTRIEQKLDPISDWDKLDTFKQESNRYQMLHNDTKLMLLGLEKVPSGEPNYSQRILNEEKFAEHIQSYIEPLAIVEHDRWNAFHFLRGWKTAPKDTTLTKAELEKLKLHRYLLPWDELSDDIKKYDKDSIIFLQVYNRAQGYELMRIEK